MYVHGTFHVRHFISCSLELLSQSFNMILETLEGAVYVQDGLDGHVLPPRGLGVEWL